MYYGGFGMYPGMGMYYDPSYFLVFIGMIVTLLASWNVNSTFNRYSRIRNGRNMTGAEAARLILDNAGLRDVSITHVRGSLTDNYNPVTRVLSLSDSTYASTSVAAVGVAAHECGHAIQHKELYLPLRLRSALVPAANLGSRLGLPLVILGFFLGMNQMLISIGIWVFAIAVLFQVVTLPVEFNASGRALRILEDRGLFGGEELGMCRKVLTAAALTYVAAAAASILQLLRLILLAGGRRSRD